jgi:hypothetical protein
MNCPSCSSPDNRIIRTEPSPKVDRRRHECLNEQCRQRWWSADRIEKSTAQLDLGISLGITGKLNDANSAKLNDANSAPRGSYSQLEAMNSDPDPSEDHKANYPARARARPRSIPGTKFTVLLEAFCARWARSYRRPYPVSAADRSQLGRFLNQHPGYIETFAEICDRYLSDRGQFLISRSGGHTLRWLVTNGLALYGGTPRESAEQHAARIRMEHEAQKRRNRAQTPVSPQMRDLIAGLAVKKAAAY